jgi:hypothetical protein
MQAASWAGRKAHPHFFAHIRKYTAFEKLFRLVAMTTGVSFSSLAGSKIAPFAPLHLGALCVKYIQTETLPNDLSYSFPNFILLHLIPLHEYENVIFHIISLHLQHDMCTAYL